MAQVNPKVPRRMNTLLSATALIVALAGIPLTYLLAKRSLQVPKLAAAIDFDVLVDPSEDLAQRGLSISFQGEDLERISRTYFALWNSRGDTLVSDDLVARDPLRLQYAEGETPLQARVISTSRRSTDFQAHLKDEAVELSFAFLDPGDGAVVEILHHGTTPPKLEGSVRGAKVPMIPKEAALTPSSLDRVAESNPVKRFLIVWKGKWLPLLVTAIPLVVLAYFFAVDIGPDLFSDASLVDYESYDLSTLSGQADFQNAVVDAKGLSVPASILLLFLGPAWVVPVIYLILRRSSRRIPSTIVAEREF